MEATHWFRKIVITLQSVSPAAAQSFTAASTASFLVLRPFAAPPTPELATAIAPHVSIQRPLGRGAEGGAAFAGIGAHP